MYPMNQILNQNLLNMNTIPLNMNAMILNTTDDDIDANADLYMSALYRLYLESHIFPTDEDFLHQVNNYPTLYRILYWLKLEHLYPHFREEEMDLASIRLMNREDIAYFHVDQSELFIRFVMYLQEVQ